MADCAGLAGHAAAVDTADDIELLRRTRQREGLANDELQRFKAEIIIDGPVVNGDLARAGINTHAGNGFFSCGRCRKNRDCYRTYSFSSFLKTPIPEASEQHAYGQRLYKRAGGSAHCGQ